jgi:hypothetical protein
MALARKSSSSNDTSIKSVRRNRRRRKFVVCVWNANYEASLQLRKIYEQLPDRRGENDGLVRIIDEEGEDYLYPVGYFIPLDLPKRAEEAIGFSIGLEAHRP